MSRRGAMWMLAILTALTVFATACSGDAAEPGATAGGDAISGSAYGSTGSSGESAVLPAQTLSERDVSSSAGNMVAPAYDPKGAASAADSATTSSGGTAQPVLDLLGRKVVRNGALDLEVESLADSYDRVSTLASSLGGYVSEGSFSGTEDSRSARLVIRVPAERYEQALAELRGIAKEVRSISSNAQDVTGEVTDLDAALRNLRAVEAQYVSLLAQARAIPDILQVQERLMAVRADIERTEGRLALLGRLTDLATISVQLAPVPVPPARVDNGTKTPLEAASAAWEASLDSIRQVAVVAVAVVVYSWWLVPVALVLAYVAARLMRNRREAREAVIPAT